MFAPEAKKTFVLYGRTVAEAFRAAKKIVKRNANFGAIEVNEENRVIRMVRNPTLRDQNYNGQYIAIAIGPAEEMGAEVFIHSRERKEKWDNDWNQKNLKILFSEIQEEAREDLREYLAVKPIFEEKAYMAYRVWVMEKYSDEDYAKYMDMLRNLDEEDYAEIFGEEEKPVTGTIICKHCGAPMMVAVGQVTKCEYCGSLVKGEL